MSKFPVVFVEYVWVGGKDDHARTPWTLRSKTKCVHGKDPATLTCESLGVWNYDGSSTHQAPGTDSEVFIYPRALYPDPFRGAPHLLAMCDTLLPKKDDGSDGNGSGWLRHPSNTRAAADAWFKQKLETIPWYGIEQEFFLMDCKTHRPLGFPANPKEAPCPQGQYYCGAGANNVYGRPIVDEMLEKCIYAGLNVSGMNAEVAPGQWELQVGPCVGIESGDQTWMCRYIMNRVTEKYGCYVDYHPKPVLGDWNGSGCHTNYSTEPMRQPGGKKVIMDAVEKLSKKHKEHIEAYGEGNELRLTGLHETSSMTEFSSGVANRGASIRIPRSVEADDCGYFEDRRPSSLMDPYVVTGLLFKTTHDL